MKFIRMGSNSISELTPTSLWVEGLPGAKLNGLVTIENDEGESFTARIIQIRNDRCLIRICDGQHRLNRGSLRVWLGSTDPQFPGISSGALKYERTPTIFRTGIAPVDALTPIQHGQTILLAGVTLRQTYPFVSSLLQGALRDRQTPCLISLDTTKNETTSVHQLWDSFGLQNEDLYVSDSRDQLHQSVTPLRLGFRAAIEHAESGRDVLLVILDLESWFRFHQEDLALRGCWRSRPAAMNSFRNALTSRLQLLDGHPGRITTLVVLSERKVAGFPSELLTLRDLFDVSLTLRGDGALSLRSWSPQPPRGIDRAIENARLLRRQTRELYEEIRARQREEYPLTEHEKNFMEALHDFLGDLRPNPTGRGERIWQILSLLPEDAVGRLPVSLLRENGRSAGVPS